MVPVAECSWPTVTSVSVMASLVVLILAVGNCCAMTRPGSAMAAPAAPATIPIMILRRWDEGGLEEEWCDMRYSFRALLVVVLVRENQRTQRASKRVERPARCHRKRTAYECSACDFSPCRCFFLFVLGWRIGFAVRRNNTLFDVKICVCRHLPGAKNHAHPHSFCPRTAWYWCVFPARR